MEITLVDKEDELAKRKKGTKNQKKGTKFQKYRLAIANILPFLKESLQKSNNGSIRLKTKDLVKELGAKFKKKQLSSITWALKFVLFEEGIVVKSGTHKNGDDLLILSKRTESDFLPPSLEKMRIENEKNDKEIDKEKIAAKEKIKGMEV